MPFLPRTFHELVEHIQNLNEFSSLRLLLEEATKGQNAMSMMEVYLKPLLGLTRKIEIQRETHRAMVWMRAFIEGARWSEHHDRALRLQTSRNQRFQSDLIGRMETVNATLQKNTEQLTSAFKQLEILRAEMKTSKEKRQLVADLSPLQYQKAADSWKSDRITLELYLGVVTFTQKTSKSPSDAVGSDVKTRHPDYCLWKTMIAHMKHFSQGSLLMFHGPSGKGYVCEWIRECKQHQITMTSKETRDFLETLFIS